MNNNFLNDDEVINYEGNLYVNPEKSQSEMLTFIENLRNIQNQNTAETAADTYNLGTSVPSNLGGLGGGGSYFEARYSTPQGVALANNLRAAARLDALNTALSNQQAMMKQRYANAQRAARQRSAARYSGGDGGGGMFPITGGVDENDTSRTVGSVEPAFSPAGSGTYQFVPNAPNIGGGSSLPWPALPSQLQNVSGTLWPAGSVDIKRNASGVITDLTYNGKTYSGDSARKMWENLGKFGNVKSGR